MKPLVLLDVDGPLNPCEAKPTRRPAGYETHRIRPRGWHKPLRVWLNPQHGPMLLKFAQRYDVELVWASMWGEEANIFIGPQIGLPRLPIIEFEGLDFRAWKYPEVRAYIGDRTAIWFDDEFKVGAYTGQRDDFLNARAEASTLLYHVDPRVGLKGSDLTHAGSWLENIRAAV